MAKQLDDDAEEDAPGGIEPKDADLHDLADQEMADDDLGDDDLGEDELGDDDLAGDAVLVVPAPAVIADDDEDDEDDDEPEDEDVEASLDVILKERLVVPDDDDDEDSPDAEDRSDSSTKVLPKQPDEFVCQSCFLVKHPSQLADPVRVLCRDCV